MRTHRRWWEETRKRCAFGEREQRSSKKQRAGSEKSKVQGEAARNL